MYTRIVLLLIIVLASFSRVAGNDFDYIAFEDYEDTLFIDFIETVNGDTLSIDFQVRSFVDIQSLQFTIAYNENLAYESFEHVAIAGEFNANLENAIGYTWFDLTGGDVTLEDGSTIFSASFIIKEGDSGEVRIVDDPVAIEVTNSNSELVLLVTDGINILFEGNLINGRLFADWNENCEFDEGETLLQDWVLTLDDNGFKSKIKTNAEGRFQRYVNGGDFTLGVNPKNNAWLPCNEEISFSLVEGENEEYIIYAGVQPSALCPKPEIAIVNSALRRCVENAYFFNYCNYGTIELDETQIEVNYGPDFTFKQATIEDVTVADGQLLIEGGSLEIGECKTFIVFFDLDCEGTELGQTHCVEAKISPYESCAVDESWSGANVEVEAKCEEGLVKFIVKNTGDGDMSIQKSFIVIEDDVMLPQFEDDYDLEKGDSIITSFPSTGKTYRLVAQQEDFHPYPNMPTAALEGCGTDEEGNYSKGYIVQFGSDDNAPFVDEYCAEVIGSFDPNDKQGFPKGYGDESYIYDNTDLEYLIRFQNTGNDTAFNVVITDVLIDELDLASIQVGPSSHPFTWDIEEENQIVFKFDNILLPDSNVNLAASNGFIKYKVKQMAGNNDGIKLTNEANIFFDFNEPIITNETIHTIGSAFIVSDIVDNTLLQTNRFKIYPNPTDQGVWIEKSRLVDHAEIKIYGTEGRLLYHSDLENHMNYFPRSIFQNGINFYKINTVSGEFYSGKVVVQK